MPAPSSPRPPAPAASNDGDDPPLYQNVQRCNGVEQPTEVNKRHSIIVGMHGMGAL